MEVEASENLELKESPSIHSSEISSSPPKTAPASLDGAAEEGQEPINADNGVEERNEDTAEVEQNEDTAEVERNEDTAEVERNKDMVEVERNKDTVEVEQNKDTVEVERNEDTVEVERNKDTVEVEQNKDTVEVEQNKNTVEVERNESTAQTPGIEDEDGLLLDVHADGDIDGMDQELGVVLADVGRVSSKIKTTTRDKPAGGIVLWTALSL